MKTKTLALISGLVGLIGGTILLLSNIFFVPFSALLGDSGLNLLGAVIKLAALGLGITSLLITKVKCVSVSQRASSLSSEAATSRPFHL